MSMEEIYVESHRILSLHEARHSSTPAGLLIHSLHLALPLPCSPPCVLTSHFAQFEFHGSFLKITPLHKVNLPALLFLHISLQNLCSN